MRKKELGDTFRTSPGAGVVFFFGLKKSCTIYRHTFRPGEHIYAYYTNLIYMLYIIYAQNSYTIIYINTIDDGYVFAHLSTCVCYYLFFKLSIKLLVRIAMFKSFLNKSHEVRVLGPLLLRSFHSTALQRAT